MAFLSEAHKSTSPYQPMQIFSYTDQELLSQGFQRADSLTLGQRSLIETLYSTLEKIKVFWWDRFRSVGIDNHGKIPPFFVHFQDNNAYYHPPTSEVPEHFTFNDQYVRYPEVVAHEFTHGVIEWLNPLGNQGEAGAINESISDVVGIVFKRSLTDKFGRPIYNDWKIDGFRDLSKTFTVSNWRTTQPTYDHQGTTTNDHGNVHHNSLLLSHAFYLASVQVEKYDPSNQKLLNIWIKAVESLSAEEKNFNGFANKTIQLAFPYGGEPIQEIVKSAWKQVGLQ